MLLTTLRTEDMKSGLLLGIHVVRSDRWGKAKSNDSHFADLPTDCFA